MYKMAMSNYDSLVIGRQAPSHPLLLSLGKGCSLSGKVFNDCVSYTEEMDQLIAYRVFFFFFFFYFCFCDDAFERQNQAATQVHLVII